MRRATLKNVILSLYQDTPESESSFSQFQKNSLLTRLQALDARARKKGLDSLEPDHNPLIGIGMEVNGGKVTKNSYGVFNLAWQAQEHPEWAGLVMAEVNEIRAGIKEAHDAPLQFLIWAGMGGSAEDKSTYNALGLLRRGPRCYVLDSTDPAKLKFILEDMQRRGKLPLADLLRRTLVVGMAMGMTSYEPVVNLEKLAALYESCKVDSRANFIYMTLPDSFLDRFARERGYRRVELQLDGANGTAGRHSAPLTRGSLYPLALSRVDLQEWIAATALTEEDILTAWRLASFLHTQGVAGRDKVTLLLPKEWAGAGLWTKQDFEESLGKSEALGIKIVIDEPLKLTNYRAPKDPRQDRVFLAVQAKGGPTLDGKKMGLLRRAGYPVALLTLPRGSHISAYMQFMHYVVFGIAWLRKMNFVTQPSVELYKAITNRVYPQMQKQGDTISSDSKKQVNWRGGIAFRYDFLPGDVRAEGATAPAMYASIIQALAADRKIEYGELTFFGDTRYSPRGRAMRATLQRAADSLFRATLKMPADVYEGPAMNHSYHEMIIGHGRCLSTVLISEATERIPDLDYPALYHHAQFLSTQMALAERGRWVVSITVKDLEEGTLRSLREFFQQTAKHLRAM